MSTKILTVCPFDNISDDFNCSTYFECKHFSKEKLQVGLIFKKQCKCGQFWSQDKLKCVSKENANCKLKIYNKKEYKVNRKFFDSCPKMKFSLNNNTCYNNWCLPLREVDECGVGAVMVSQKC